MTAYPLHLLCAMTLVLSVVLLAGFLLRRRSASLRHSIYAAGMVGVLFIPAASALLPHWSLTLFPSQKIEPQTVTSAVPSADACPRSPIISIPDANRPSIQAAVSKPETVASFQVLVFSRDNARGVVLVVWGIGAGLLFLRLSLSISAARKIVSKTRPLHEPMLEILCRTLKITRPVELRQSEIGIVPFTVGIRKPVVVLPENSDRWPLEECRAVLTHELGHVARGDVFWQRLATFCCALYWFHPLVWFTARQLRIDREIACDDLVVLAGEEPSTYASVLLRLALKLKGRGALRPVLGCSVAMARHHEVKQRITAILDPKLLRKPLGRAGTILLFAVTALGVALASAISPTEVPKGVIPPENVGISGDSDQQVELRLTVVDEEKQPVPDATIRLSYNDNTKTAVWHTDTEGRVITKIPLSAVQPSNQLYLTHRERGLRAWESFWNIPPEWTPDKPIELTYTMFRSRRLTGTVLDADGKPVSDAIVGYSVAPSAFHVMTDENGRFELDAMRFQPLLIYAVHPTFGAAVWYPDFPAEESWRAEGGVPDDDWVKGERNNGPFTLKLERPTTVRVKVLDMDGNPIEGVSIFPSYFATEKSYWNTWDFSELLGVKTDANGVAVFPWIPTEDYSTISFSVSGSDPRFDTESPARFFGTGNVLWKKENDTKELEIRLPKKILLRGSVRYEDGSVPRAGMQMHLSGKGYDSVGVETDYRGNFEFFVNAGETISLHPIYNRHRKERPAVAQAKLRVQIGDGATEPSRFDFVLKPGVKVHGNLPNGQSRLTVYEMSGPDDKTGNQNERLGVENEDGRYETLLPPGIYRFAVGGKDDTKEYGLVTVPGDVEEVRIDLD